MFQQPNLIWHYFRLSLRKFGLLTLTVLLPLTIMFSTYYYITNDPHNYIYLQMPRINYSNSFELPTERRYSNRQIIVVTPTFPRSDRPADILGTSYALMSVPNSFWLLIEDDNTTAPVIREALRDKDIKYAYISHPNDGLPCSGWSQYNKAFDYIKQNKDQFDPNAVIYLANDNDAYGLDLFEHYIRPVKRIGVWPVGLTNYFLQLPKVKDGKVVGFEQTLKASGHLGLYFGGFAFHISYILQNDIKLTTKCAGLYGEECLINQFNITTDDYEVFGVDDEHHINLQMWRRTTPTMFNRNFPKFGYLIDTVPPRDPVRAEMCEKFRNIYKMTEAEANEASGMVNVTWDPNVRIPPMEPITDVYYVSGRDISSL